MLKYKTEFHAAHYIKDHPECGKLHGHTYKIIVSVTVKKWLDFKDLKKCVDQVIAKYDHENLGYKTCEGLANEILYMLENMNELKDNHPMKLEIWETSKFGVEL